MSEVLWAFRSRGPLISASDVTSILDDIKSSHGNELPPWARYRLLNLACRPRSNALVKRTFVSLAESRELARLYEQWFLHKLSSGKTLGISMSPQLRSIFETMGQSTTE